MPQEYLSTDPTAGLPESQYLSTDPNAGSTEDTHSWLQKQIEGALGLPPNSLDPVKHAVGAIVDQAKKHPAAMGAMIAGAATAPLTGGMSLAPAVGFSGLMAGGGAAAGLLAHDMANAGTPGNIPTPKDSAEQIAAQAALGAGGEAVGRGVQAGAEKLTPVVSQYLYKLGLNPSKTLTRNFPTAAETGLDQGLMPSAEAVQSRLTQVEQGIQDAVKQANAQVSPAQLAVDARNFVLKRANLTGPGGRGMQAGDIQQLNAIMKQYLAENPSSLALADSLGQKRAEQSLATAAYNAEKRGATVNQIETLWHEGLAAANRKAVIAAVPSAADDLATEQGLIGLKAMVDDRALKGTKLSPLEIASMLGLSTWGHPEAAAGLAAMRVAMQSPTLTGAVGLATKKLGELGASDLTPSVIKALAAAYGPSQPQAGQ